MFGFSPTEAALAVPGQVIVALWAAFLILNLIAVGALLFIWMERKIAGRIQDRLGPTRVGGRFGWLQTLADGIKLIAKEDLMPGGADGLLFRLAPYVAFCASFGAFIALPFATGWVGLELNVAVFFITAVLGLEVFGVILAGYASASKWSLFGAMREAAQVISYEVPLGLCIVIPVMIAGTMDLIKIGNEQAGWFTNWFLFHDPFTFITAFVYFTCATASVNRAPFDLAEAESELVAGFHTEYSGLRWSFFFMAEYGSMLLVSALGAILFCGGWNGPIPVVAMIGGEHASQLSGFAFVVANLLGTIMFLGKAILGVTLMMWARWTLPRLRIDQVITTCWKYCTPIVGVMFIGVMVWQAYQLPSPRDLGWGSLEPGSVREAWHPSDEAKATPAVDKQARVDDLQMTDDAQARVE
ncbi:MAG: NADH-quinone oxidoreductase subunit H [Planctomycetota bacterium]|nr:MAG: NADH-quinone oxidoreductase subunit H [Planctomycetota bacterium]REK25521.1 MAG: NADH-quinone oxidoreductase subunit H [Planctomycetota bacterium]REK45952.1 MAG: NADH-quinone oxidoreductase subunit H [Planctomycetota bacterium]